MESVRPVGAFRQRLEDSVLVPLRRSSRGYVLWIGFLLLVLAWGVYAYSVQVREGLFVTGMRDRISWGLYIILFVFFIGISHAGTLISAILRVSKAGWRTPITRMAEFITVVALMTGALMPLIDMGRPDRLQNLILFGRWQSPIIWDILSITTYLTGSFIYLYLPLIPDFAMCRDRLVGQVPKWKHTFYRLAAVGWRSDASQKQRLALALGMMMVIIIPVAVSVHTVVSWIFAATLREAWNNPMFGPFFVAGAIYSGIATIILVMAILRKVFHLEEFITVKHFTNLGYMLGGFSLIMMYFNVNEYAITGYKMAGEVSFHLGQLFTGALAPWFWFYTLGGMMLPGLLILFPKTRTFKGILVAAVLVDLGMWVERYLIVVGGLRVPLMPYEAASYTPSWVELSIMAGAFAWFALIISIFVKVLPLIAVWEVAEQHEEAAARTPHQEAPIKGRPTAKGVLP